MIRTWLRTWCANGYGHDVQMATGMMCKWPRTCCANGYGHAVQMATDIDVQMATDMMCRWLRTWCANGHGHDVQMATDMMCKWQQAWCANGHGHAVQMATDMMCKWLRTWWLRTWCANGDRHDVQMATGMMCNGYGHDVEMATNMMCKWLQTWWLRTWCADGFGHDAQMATCMMWKKASEHGCRTRIMSKQLRKMLAKPCPDSGREQRCQNGRGALGNGCGDQKFPKECSVTVPEPKVQIVRQQSLSFCRPMGEDFASICSAGSASKFTTRRDSTPTGPLTQFSRSTPHSANSKRSVLSWQAVKENKENVLPAHTTGQAIPHGLRSSLLIEVCFQNSKQIAETPCLVTQHLQGRIQTTSHVG